MKCLSCNNSNIVESLSIGKYSFMLFPFSKSLKCCNCDTKYDVLFLIATPKKIKYVITKSNPIIPVRDVLSL
jgi:hypothetical protein